MFRYDRLLDDLRAVGKAWATAGSIALMSSQPSGIFFGVFFSVRSALSVSGVMALSFSAGGLS